jgi:hypothetical protein
VHSVVKIRSSKTTKARNGLVIFYVNCDTNFEISVGDESVDDFGDDAAHESGVEQGDVGDPEHAEDERAHKYGEVAAPVKQ